MVKPMDKIIPKTNSLHLSFSQLYCNQQICYVKYIVKENKPKHNVYREAIISQHVTKQY